MRITLILLLICGLVTIGLGFFQQAEDVARWSNGYALFETLGNKDPLKDPYIRDQYHRLFFKRESAAYVSLLGALTSILSVIGLLQMSRTRRTTP